MGAGVTWKVKSKKGGVRRLVLGFKKKNQEEGQGRAGKNVIP